MLGTSDNYRIHNSSMFNYYSANSAQPTLKRLIGPLIQAPGTPLTDFNDYFPLV